VSWGSSALTTTVLPSTGPDRPKQARNGRAPAVLAGAGG